MPVWTVLSQTKKGAGKETTEIEEGSAYHSKAPKTIAAVIVWQMRPQQVTRFNLKWVMAAHPESQRSHVKASRPNSTTLVKMRGKKRGPASRIGLMRRVQREVKMRKLTIEGESL